MIAQSPNQLLAALPPGEYRRLLPELHTIHLRASEVLPHCGETRVYFPGAGMCSIGNVMHDERAIEIAAVGHEGVVGLGALAAPFTKNAYMQVADGSAQYLLVEAFDRELTRSGAFRRLIDRFSRSLLESIIESAACNRLHTLQERCVRWLLSASDRIERRQFELTPAFLAKVLGVKKSKLSVVMKRLETLTAAESDGATITIIDRDALERLACHCYQRLKRHREQASPAGASARQSRGNVVQLVPEAVCSRCQSSADLPHQTEHECIVAIDRELRTLTSRSTMLYALRKQLIEERVRAMKAYLLQTRTGSSS